MHFSIDWQCLSSKRNVIEIQVTFLDSLGNSFKVIKYYEEWIGICTNNIEKVVQAIQENFPGYHVKYHYIGNFKKVLPYFEDRLIKNKLDYRDKPFYKVYTNASHKNIGKFFNRYKIGYYEPDDWLIRIYIDLCCRYNTFSFYYQWYEINDLSPGLMDSFIMHPHEKKQPNWNVAAFDIESVPLKGNHIPLGYHETDRIVMISVYQWKLGYEKDFKKWLLYLLPNSSCQPLPGYEEFAFYSESDLLIEFHKLLEPVHIITGYNINAFDFPCIFARLLWLKLYTILKHYTSINVGSDLVIQYHHKITLDLYTYFKTFSGYDLPSFKLDDVARVKLKGVTKLSVKATGIWSWYRNTLPVQDLIMEDDVQRCFDQLKPETVNSALQFGTFRMYLDYCLKDSELVYHLFNKEHVLSFLVQRAGFTALNAIEVLHLGNSRYLLELYKTYAIRKGYFINPNFFKGFSITHHLIPEGKTYQGALNFCTPEKIYEDVSVMDFTSMYPNALLSSNLCYGTCTIMTREAWLSIPVNPTLIAIPYRQHSDNDFINSNTPTSTFSYPTLTELDEQVIVINTSTRGFLPEIVEHFIDLRKHHQNEYKKTKDIYHYNIQLGIKILINSLYGVMANKDSPLAYLPIAMAIVTLSRYQLLGSYHYLKHKGYDVCYADTDSLMVHRWPLDNCDEINAFLNIKHVELKYEQRMKKLLILSKKRYVYERSDNNGIVTKGFQKKINGLVEYMTENILTNVWHALFEDPSHLTPERGWMVWVETIQEANYRCRDPKKYSIYRKIKNLEEYKSTNCPSVKYLKKYPDKNEEHVEFTYSRADVAITEASNWVMDVEDCQWVNYEQLFISQKKIFCLLLNMTYWHLPDSVLAANTILNNLHWKRFVHAELLHWHHTRKRLVLMVENGLKYTFTMNDHLIKERRKPGRKRKVNL